MSNNQLCRHSHTQDEHPRCFEDAANLHTQLEKPLVRVLVFDIETLPILGYVWGAYDQNLNVDSVVKDWCILAWSAKWLGSDKIISDILSPKEAVSRDDERLSKDCWKLLDKADVVITHNGRSFDIKKINTRFMFHEMLPPSSYKTIDTKVAARSVFGMTMNKQDYIAKFLGMERKLDTDFQLWVDCDNGKKKALKQMREYNENDVEMLEEIYLRIRAWIPGHPNMSLISNTDCCPVCMGSYVKSGIYYANQRKYNEFRCNDCGAIFHGTISLKA